MLSTVCHHCDPVHLGALRLCSVLQVTAMIGTGRHVVRECLICSCFMFYWRRTDLQYQLIIIILLWKIKITIEINIRLNVQPYIRNTKQWVIFWWTFLSNTDVKIKHKICYLMLASFFSYLLFYLLLISFYVRDKDMFIIHKQLKFFKTFQESYFGHTAWKM